MAYLTIRQRLEAIKAETSGILAALDTPDARGPRATRAAEALQRFQSLSRPHGSIGCLAFPYRSRPDSSGLARVFDIRDEMAAAREALLDVPGLVENQAVWVQEFDDVMEAFWDV